jgi:hypothetical protein
MFAGGSSKRLSAPDFAPPGLQMAQFSDDFEMCSNPVGQFKTAVFRRKRRFFFGRMSASPQPTPDQNQGGVP